MRSCILLILVEKKVLFNVYSFFGIQPLPFFFFLYFINFCLLRFLQSLEIWQRRCIVQPRMSVLVSSYSLKCAISKNFILMLLRVVQLYFIPLFLKSLYLLNYRLFPSSWHHFSWCFKERQYIIYMFLFYICVFLNVKYFSLSH